MSIELASIRRDTPGVGEVIHLNSCGSALMPNPVVEAMSRHLELEARIGGYAAQAERADELDTVYESLARLLGAGRGEVAIAENATAAWCQAFYAVPLGPGDRVLTCEAEYAANFVALLHRSRRDGFEVVVVPSDGAGQIDLEALEDLLDERVKLVALTWVPTNGGLVNPAAEVGRLVGGTDAVFLLDACQAVGQMPVDVAELRCDFLTGTGRKFLRGPRGIGFLYVRSDLIADLDPVMIDHFAAPWVADDRYELRPDARRFETWENSYVLRAGLGAAVAYAREVGIEEIRQRAWGLADGLRHRLAELRGAVVRDVGTRRCAIVSFTLDGLEPTAVAADLAQRGVQIGTSEPASTRLDAARRSLPTVLRAAPHYYNTEEELDVLIGELAGLVRSPGSGQ